jgi:excinuclease ABC subunit C
VEDRPEATIDAALREKLDGLPSRPGVYLYRNARGKVIYIGKAKSLRNRVRSYFQPSARHEPRIARMVGEIVDLEIIVVPNELEALILESNLIKRDRPRYNVLLRDDKNFPYLKLSMRDEYPRLSLVRRARLDGNAYVGPFLPASTARRSIKLVQRHFQVATCKEVFDGKRRPCLYYHLQQCLAPCAGKTDPEEYGRAVKDARLFLEGRDQDLERSLEAQMATASAEQRYEEAARLRDTLQTMRRLTFRRRISSVGLDEQDYLAHHSESGQVALEIFQIRMGRVQSRRQFTLEDVSLSPAELYATVIAQYYAEVDPPGTIHVSLMPAQGKLLERWLTGRRGTAVRLRVPQRGPKRRLLETVRRNAQVAFEARFRKAHGHGVRGFDELAGLFDLDEPPYRIECFDISNVQGTDSVASMVVWEGGKPRKSEYRSFNIRGVEGPDDFASIAEAVLRRYRRRVAEDKPLPDLVLIDGGAGQLGAAVSALAQAGLPTLPVAAIAKREEEIHLQQRSEPVRAPRDSPGLQLVQRIRDEAHRFAVSRHRGRRRRRTLRTELTDIRGVGPATARRLLREFGSVKGVRDAAPEALERCVGPAVAAKVRSHFSHLAAD